MAGTIPQAFIDDLLERVDIVEVIDHRVKLKKAGKNYTACCPFHDEKTPSFTVSPDKQFYYCFGCGATGNSLGFIMDFERTSFPEAVESLAKVAGVEVPKEQTKDPKKRAQDDARERERKSLYTLLESADVYFQQQLRHHPQKLTPVNYLINRGLSGHIARDFGIGYAPAGWDNLLSELGKTEEAQKRLLEGGMLIHNEERKSLYDRFRDRIMFPIRDTRGRVIGFGGRVLDDSKPKYLNSPETPIFHKGKELYGLYEARQAHRQLPRLLVVEGYMDVVALAQHDIRYGVATLGTACGEDHLTRAFRYTNEIVFCFDGDAAGRKAAKRAMEVSLPAMQDGRQIKFLYLPEGEDPDTLVRQIGADKFTRLIEGASPLETFLFEELSQGINIQTMEGRARLCKLAAPLIDQLPRGVYRELMFGQLAKRTQLSMDALKTLLEELPDEPPAASQEPAPAPTAKPKSSEASKENGRQDDSNYPQTESFITPVEYVPAHEQYTPTSSAPTHTEQTSTAPNKAATAHFTTEEVAIALLLYQPQLAVALDGIEQLRHSREDSVVLLVNLIDLLQQRPEFTSSQILGHWQGTYGSQAAGQLQQMLNQAALFHKAHTLMSNSEKHAFNPANELKDALAKLCQQQQSNDCDRIIEQLEGKPRQQWTDAEKQLYLKAISARAQG